MIHTEGSISVWRDEKPFWGMQKDVLSDVGVVLAARVGFVLALVLVIFIREV